MSDVADIFREMGHSIILLFFIIGFIMMDRRVKKLEYIVDTLNEENRQNELIEKAELREVVNEATKEKE